MIILIAVLPSILWGINPVLCTLIGGKPIQQLIGNIYGEFVIGLTIYLIYLPSINGSQFFWPFMGGLAWSIAQLLQLMAFKLLNVSLSMPISTGLQLIETPLVGIILWNEWPTLIQKIVGFSAILILLLGIILTSYQDKKFTLNERRKLNYKAGLTALIIGSFAYTALNVFPNIAHVHGTVGILPQALGMSVGGLCLALYYQFKKRIKVITAKFTLKNTLVGLIGGIGNFCYLYSLHDLGAANAFPLTQMNVVVSTLGGIFILKEHKDHKELCCITLGLICIISAATVIAHL